MIHIACNIDERFAQHCAVTLVSAFKNNPGQAITAHIIARGLTESSRRRLAELATAYGATLRFYEPAPDLLDGFSIRKCGNRISITAYYRCLLPELLPADVDRVLYLDCDILVLQPLDELWQTPLDGVAAGVVEDIANDDAPRYARLEYPQELGYFNSGVLLLNLVHWRKHHLAEACRDYFHRYPERIVYNDQDLLNCVLCRSKRALPLKWNVQDAFYRRPAQLTTAWRDKYAEALLHPAILHYSNRKPWLYDSQHPLRRLYHDYLHLTPWHDAPAGHSASDAIRRFFRLLPFRLRLRRPKYVDLKEL